MRLESRYSSLNPTYIVVRHQVAGLKAKSPYLKGRYSTERGRIMSRSRCCLEDFITCPVLLAFAIGALVCLLCNRD